jgi:uncharacterized protein
MKIKVSSNEKGRCITATDYIAKGEAIEAAPVIIFNASESIDDEGLILSNYSFEWDSGYGAIALGYGSLYNHSYNPNADYARNMESKEIYFFAIKDINPEEEVTVNYNGDPDDKTPVWFDVK